MSTAQTTVEPATAPAAAPGLWTVAPGWGIAADLTPIEVRNARHLKVVRKLIAAGIVVLLLLCAGGYVLAQRANTRATEDLAAVQDQTLALQKDARSYSGVVSIQGSVSQVQVQVAQVMSADVDLVALMVALQSNLPKTMTITQEAINISPVGVVGATTVNAGSSLDQSGLPRIGTITLSGSGKSIDDLSDYVDRLSAVTGLVDVLPVSNTAVGGKGVGTQFTMTIGMTTALLSHRFDVGDK